MTVVAYDIALLIYQHALAVERNLRFSLLKRQGSIESKRNYDVPLPVDITPGST